MNPVETQPAEFSVDFEVLFEFADAKTGEAFGVSLATLLQCLCIAEQRYLVPPFEPDWEWKVIPPTLRASAACNESRQG
ncbi:hypothetical protein [Candidatus Thiothrix anitrata]|jgi:hypothetical protein|uniref:Uncharacterized protein n=1 Tax=Candidatus Thiothrix anitrata TaxID=2823902 RepID=A0ABX7X8P7_9GAMM|nr:hypothetical protein [Candidatus Thiothrix anitrata]QTR51594.1 hypothetical protein J8380_08655 [Candidatus Thiothrix anitrata]